MQTAFGRHLTPCRQPMLLRSWQEAAEADRRRRHKGPSAAETAAAWEAEKAEAKIAKVSSLLPSSALFILCTSRAPMI